MAYNLLYLYVEVKEMAENRLAKQVMTEFAEQDKVNAYLESLKQRYGRFAIAHEFGKCWLIIIEATKASILLDPKGEELGKWEQSNTRAWGNACNIIQARNRKGEMPW